METIEASEQETPAFLEQAAELSKRVEAVIAKYERKPELLSVATDEQPRRPPRRDQAEPPAKLHRWLRLAYMSTSPIIENTASQVGAVLERAEMYAQEYQRRSCGRCEGEGEIPPKPHILRRWRQRYRLLALLMGEDEFAAKFPEPKPRRCPRCGGSKEQAGQGGVPTAYPSGSSVQASAPPIDHVGVIMVARMGRVCRRVAELSYRHGRALWLYYGDHAQLTPLAAASGRLVTLYPMTPVGRALLAGHEDQNPWRCVSEHIQNHREDDNEMAREAYELLVDATDTWDAAVEIEVPDWRDIEQRRASGESEL